MKHLSLPLQRPLPAQAGLPCSPDGMQTQNYPTDQNGSLSLERGFGVRIIPVRVIAVPGHAFQAGKGESVAEHHPGDGLWLQAVSGWLGWRGSSCSGNGIPRAGSRHLATSVGSSATGRVRDEGAREAVTGPDAKPSTAKSPRDLPWEAEGRLAGVPLQWLAGSPAVKVTCPTPSRLCAQPLAWRDLVLLCRGCITWPGC